MTGAILLTGACSSPGGVAGINTRPPAPAAEAMAAEGPITATIPPAASSQTPIEIPKGDDPVPVPPPKVSKFTYTFPVKGCSVSYQSRLLVLPKTTIWTGKGCAFVSPVDGVVHEVNDKNRWRPSTDRGRDREGRFVTIAGDDGVLYLGGHLDSITPGIAPGVRVSSGQQLGLVGNSGNARDTASNLYFAISWKTDPSLWWVRRGMVKPWNYLNSWLKGNRTLSPADETRAVMSQTGATPRCTILCASKPTPEPTRKPRKPRDENIDIGTADPAGG
ncbi:peptidoglycan DD-metalloendopeptidase family protein [Planobispora siamensis]|uniref:M23 family metallopeptidase n=1 Tax=Planobispora siamensis TaxID=936338 RepID=UPI001EF181A5|nr:M23 family metallopeptidase [Planobispora siamensis]